MPSPLQKVFIQGLASYDLVTLAVIASSPAFNGVLGLLRKDDKGARLGRFVNVVRVLNV